MRDTNPAADDCTEKPPEECVQGVARPGQPTDVGKKWTCYGQELNDRRLTLAEGSCLSERDLVRTSAHCAAAILLLADRFSPSAHQEDLGLQFQARTLLSLGSSGGCQNN